MPASILVVRLGAMGDIVHTLPAAASLKHSFPGVRIVWAVEPKWAYLLEANPYVDEVIAVDRRGLAALAASWRALRRPRFEVAVDFQGLIKSALTAAVARPDRIYGFHQSQIRERLAALCYSNKVCSGSRHVVDRNLDLAAATGAANLLKTFPLPPGRPEGDLPAEPFVLASPLAGWISKQWPREYYARLAAELHMPLVVNGPDAGAAVPGAVLHVSSIAGLIYATRRAAAVVGVDSGPLHLAAALGKPGVAIFGPTDPARNGPYGGAFTVLRAAGSVTSYKRGRVIDPSMAAVTPAQVFEALRERLTRQPSSAGCLA